MISSSKFYIYFYKIGGLFPIFLLLLSWIMIAISPENNVTESSNEINNITLAAIFLPIISIVFLLWFRIGRKLDYVEMNEETIIIFKSKNTFTYNWQQVESIKKIILTIPVSYVIKFKGESTKYYFCSISSLPAPFHILDTTTLGNLIKKKKKQISNNH